MYGEGAKEAVARIPSLAPLLKEIEEPHRRLHESAIKIAGQFQVADENLPEFLAAVEIGHMVRIDRLNRALLLNKDKIPMAPNERKCSFGKWLYGPEAKKTAATAPSSDIKIGLFKPTNSMKRSTSSADTDRVPTWILRFSSNSSKNTA